MTEQSHERPQVEIEDKQPDARQLITWALHIMEVPVPPGLDGPQIVDHQRQLWIKTARLYLERPSPVPGPDPRTTGTVTLLGGGRTIVGMPAVAGGKPELHAYLQEIVGAWRAGTEATLVLPFPVEVKDER